MKKTELHEAKIRVPKDIYQKTETHETKIRVPKDIYQKIVERARKNYRSINAEIVEILKRQK